MLSGPPQGARPTVPAVQSQGPGNRADGQIKVKLPGLVLDGWGLDKPRPPASLSLVCLICNVARVATALTPSAG